MLYYAADSYYVYAEKILSFLAETFKKQKNEQEVACLFGIFMSP